MLKELDTFYLNQPEPNQSYMLGLRHFILNYNMGFTEKWKWKLPFFYYKNKPFCYIWKDSKTQQVYLGLVQSDKIEHPKLIQGNRKKMKVLYFDTDKDLPVQLLSNIFDQLIVFYD